MGSGLHLPFYELRSPEGVEEATHLVSGAILSEFGTSAPSQTGYPRNGRLELIDVPNKPGWKETTCPPGEAPAPAGSCIALDKQGSMIEMRTIDFPIAAYYPFVVYVVPRGGVLDLETTPRILMGVHAYGEPSQQLEIYERVAAALRKVGAKGFSP
jgi:hypothetical protein